MLTEYINTAVKNATYEILSDGKGDISKDLLARVLRQAEIDKDTWERL